MIGCLYLLFDSPTYKLTWLIVILLLGMEIMKGCSLIFSATTMKTVDIAITVSYPSMDCNLSITASNY